MSHEHQTAEPCQYCQIGHLQPTQATFARIFNGTLVQAPSVRAWRCDMCGELTYDPAAVRRIMVLVGEAGPPPNGHTVAPDVPHLDPAASQDDTPDNPSPTRKL